MGNISIYHVEKSIENLREEVINITNKQLKMLEEIKKKCNEKQNPKPKEEINDFYSLPNKILNDAQKMKYWSNKLNIPVEELKKLKLAAMKEKNST